MKYNTILFDFDYTLVNSSAGIVKCFRIVLEQHEHLNISDEDIKRTIGKTLEESFSILTGITDAETLHIYRREYVTEADKYMTDNTFLFPETKNVLAKLKESGAKIGIISTKYKYRIQQFLDLNFPKDFFDIIIGLEEVENYKPAPDGILKAIKTLKRQEERDYIYRRQYSRRRSGTKCRGRLYGSNAWRYNHQGTGRFPECGNSSRFIHITDIHR
jgi:Predicted phosphatases